MSRDLNAAIITAVEAGVLDVFVGVEGFFPSGVVRLWAGLGDMTVDGRVFTGAGSLIQVSEVEETATLSASGVTLTLSGVPSTLISLALNEPYQNSLMNLYFGVTKPSPVASVVFSGYVDQMIVSDGPDSSTITVTVENKLIDLERPRSRRYTHADQQLRYPGDRGLEFVESLQTKEIFWGKARPS